METDASRPWRVFLADDHPVVLDGVKAMVGADPKLSLAGEARDGRLALRLASELRPDVVVLDLSMPDLNGIEVARRLLAVCPECRILVLTAHEDRSYVRQLLSMGVSGYVLKRSPSEVLSQGIHAVAAGGTYLDPAFASRVTHPHAPASPASLDATAADILSARELEVLRLTAAGHSNKAIGARLFIGVKTVDTYKARAMAKLGFETRVELVRYGLSQGWLNDPWD